MKAVKQQPIQTAHDRLSVLDQGAVTPWRIEADPFAKAAPLTSLSDLTGGLPDDREADEILQDLDRCRVTRTRRR